MWQLTIRNLFEHKRRVLLTAIAVVLGVAFIGATGILGATVNESLTASAGSFYEQTAADVRGEAVGPTDDRAPVPTALSAELAEVEGVTDVLELTLEPVTVVGDDGKVLPLPVTAGTWSDGLLAPLTVTDGEAPAASGEAAISTGVADDTGLGVGDEVTFESAVGPATSTITAVVEAEGSSVAGVPELVLSADDRTLLLPEGQVTEIALVGDGVDLDDVTAVTETSGVPLDVRSGSEAAADAVDDAEADATAISASFTAFGSLSLFVGVFIIYNTFNILMAQRRREMALLRAIGVRRKQVVRSVLAEATAIGFVAGVLGAALGVLIAVLAQGWILDGIEGSLVIAPTSLVSGVLMGVATTASSAWIPARRASKVAPVEALRESATDSSAQSKLRIAFGLVLAVVTGLLVAGGLAPEAEDPAIVIGLASFVGLLALIVLSPLLARLLVPAFGFPVKLLRGQVGNLATENARRQPQRTAATATALLLGVAIVGFALVIAASLKASVSTAIEDRVSADHVVAPVTFGSSLSPGAVEAAQAAAGDAPTSLSWTAPAEVDGSSVTLFAVDSATGAQLWDFRPEGGSLDELGDDGVLVDRHVAEDEGWAVGDTVEIGFGGEPRDYTIRATGDSRPFGADYVIDSGEITTLAPTAVASQLLVGDGPSRDQLADALADFPNADVTTPADMAEEINSSIDLLLQVLFGFLGLSVVIAFIGVANTLALSIHERTRELGILRAIALRKSHVRSAVRWEAAIIAALGTTLGIVYGAAFGAALAKVLEDTGFARLDIPWLQLLAVVIGAACAGALAAALPARRAAKLNVLDAIHQL